MENVLEAKASKIPDEIAKSIDLGMWQGAPMIVSYRDDSGFAKTSYRGSAHMHDGDIAIWLRSKTGGLQGAARKGARLTLVHRNPRTGSFVNMQGPSRLVEDDAVLRRIYDEMDPRERAADRERAGVGIIVNVERVAGRFGGEPLPPPLDD